MCKKIITYFYYSLYIMWNSNDNKLLGKIIGSGLGALVGFQLVQA